MSNANTAYTAIILAGIVCATAGVAFGWPSLIFSSAFATVCLTLGWNMCLIAKAKDSGQKLAVKTWAFQYTACASFALVSAALLAKWVA